MPAYMLPFDNKPTAAYAAFAKGRSGCGSEIFNVTPIISTKCVTNPSADRIISSGSPVETLLRLIGKRHGIS
jgi:hypothetical protein